MKLKLFLTLIKGQRISPKISAKQATILDSNHEK